jgi:hypothetical protein
MRYSTHDWCSQSQNGISTQWVDVKTPGTGNTYVIGNTTTYTTMVNPAPPGQPARFSGEVVEPPVPSMGFDIQAGGNATRQVAILQIVGPNQEITPFPGLLIPRQRYFYGSSGTTANPIYDRPTHARAISVWPTSDPATTRVAICGETKDERLPSSNAPNGWTPSPERWSGYIAVFNGYGVLQWTHHFFGGNSGDSAVTDLSIRRESRTVTGPSGTTIEDFDVVTYCGISSHGNPTPNGTLDDVNAFTLTGSSPLNCPNIALGNADNGAGQWDGFTGRLSRQITGGGTYATTKDFHSVVGGQDQDGLFALAELDAERFVVVGSARDSSATTSRFPFTHGACMGTGSGSIVGVLMLFRVFGGVVPQLDISMSLGSNLPNQANQTFAKDVLVQPDYRSGMPLAVVVGNTDDINLLSTLSFTSYPPTGTSPVVRQPVLGPQTIHGGGVDGFIFACHIPVFPASARSDFEPVAASFRGGAGNEGLVGVAGWNEFVDHFAVVGDDSLDIDVASYVIDSGGSTSGAARPMREMTASKIGGFPGIDRPAPSGYYHCIDTSSTWFQPVVFGDASGGGVAVDSRGRVTMVGSTLTTSYPATTSSAPFGRLVLPAPPGSPNGVRSTFDLLPPGSHTDPSDPFSSFTVGRTDGTGASPGSGITYPNAGIGGTTPECALSPFGKLIGVTPSLPRMLIDCSLNIVPNGLTSFDLVVTRTPASYAQFAAWQLGFPGVGLPPVPTPLPGGAMIWVNSGSALLVQVPGTAETIIQNFPLPPAGSAIWTVQLVVLPLGGVLGGTGPGQCSGISDFAASPALWFSY